MDFDQVFTDPEVKQEFLDRFDQLSGWMQGPAGGLQGLDGGGDKRQAEKTVDAMAEGRYAPEGSGLEAIVERFTRPVHLVQDDTFRPPPDRFPESEVINERLVAGRAALERAIPSSGRVDLRNHRLAWVGTAWMVAPDVAVTNRHVAEVFARAEGTGFAFRTNMNRQVRASVDWKREHDRPDESIFRVEEVLWIEPDDGPDVALLRIDRDGENGESLPPPIELLTEDEYAAARVGHWIGVIGYPARDSRNDADDQQRIFDGVYDVKRVAVGRITALTTDPLVQHDATTLGGNSGSTLLDLESGKAVALHFGGIQGSANYSVPAPVVRRILDDHGR